MNGARTDVPEMIALYESGWTLESIGQMHGITRERVRQIMRAHDVPKRGRGQSPDRGADPVRIMAGLRAPGVLSIAEGARRIGASDQQARHLVRELGCGDALDRLYRLRRRARLIAEMRALAARLGRTPSQYDLNAKHSGTCTHSEYVRIFGSVSGAQRAAGLTPNGAGGAGHRAPPAKRTHCKRGHLLTAGNVYEYKGQRRCAVCDRARSREHYRREHPVVCRRRRSSFTVPMLQAELDTAYARIAELQDLLATRSAA